MRERGWSGVGGVAGPWPPASATGWCWCWRWASASPPATRSVTASRSPAASAVARRADGRSRGWACSTGPSRFALRATAPPRVSWRGVFVSFEGADGSGKSTQAELLRAALAAEARDVVLTREPGGTELGEQVRQLVLNGPVMGAWAEATLFAASRAEHVEEVIRPALERGADVICDRYVDSSLAYQGIARGLGVDDVLQLNLAVTGGLLPDVTFLLLLDPGVATGRQVDPDRLEREGTELQAKVDAAYRELAERFPDRIVTIDASREPEEIAKEVRERLRDRS
jgi:dTMP kinase